MKKLTTEEFIKRAIAVHGDKYDYSKVDYKNKEEKVCIICPKHGEFWQKAGNHLLGRGCCKCGHERTNASKVLSNEEFILRANVRHNNKYNYDKTNYLGFDKDVIVTCPIHGDFLVNAHQHISNLTGCPECAKLTQGPARSNTQEFIEKAVAVHGSKYDYSKVDYVLATKKVEIVCPKHGSFLMTPNKHLIGEGCPKCSETKGEQLVSKILSESNYIFDTQYVIPVVSDIRDNIRIDFVVKNQDITYLIEYHGIQHYQPVDYFGGLPKFVEQQDRDNLLRKLVLENESYKLLEIDYRWSQNTIKSKILEFLKDVPISSNANSKPEELLETPEMDNQQPSLGLTTEEGSETNTWNLNEEYNSDTSIRHLEIDDDIVRTT